MYVFCQMSRSVVFEIMDSMTGCLEGEVLFASPGGRACFNCAMTAEEAHAAPICRSSLSLTDLALLQEEYVVTLQSG